MKEFDLDLDGRLAALDKPLRVVLDGKEQDVTLHPQLLTLCQSLLERGDPQLAYHLSGPPDRGEKGGLRRRLALSYESHETYRSYADS